MSATGRTRAQVDLPGFGHERHADDFYATPSWATAALLRDIGTLPESPVLDPGCGDGAILAAVRSHQPGVMLLGVEIDPDRAAAAEGVGALVVRDDFRSWADRFVAESRPKLRTIISNPPFTLAEEWVRTSLRILDPLGEAHFLLRMGFLAGGGRFQSGLWRHLRTVRVLPKRPSFTPDGKTDSADYAWMTFRTAPTRDGWRGRHLDVEATVWRSDDEREALDWLTARLPAAERALGVPLGSVLGRRRVAPAVRARQAVMAALMDRGWSSVRVGRVLGYDHSTVVHAGKSAREEDVRVVKSAIEALEARRS